MLKGLMFAFALPLCADGSGDLKAALLRLRGREPVRATVQLGEWQRTVEDKQPREQAAQAEFQVADGPAGFSLTVPPTTAERVREEVRRPVPKDKKARKGLRPVTDLVASFGTMDAAELLNAAEPLLRLLDGAVLQEDRPDPAQGPGLRLLGFQLPTEEEAKMGAKAKATGQVKVWTGADGTPVASLRVQGFEAGFMWIKAKGEERVSRRYAAESGRLLVLEETRENSVSGAGEEARSKRSLKLLPRREPRP